MRSQITKRLVLGASAISLGCSVFLVWQVGSIAASAEAWAMRETAPREVASVDASPAALPVVSLDQIFVNIATREGRTHSLALSMDLELFDEQSRSLIDKYQSSLKHAVIQTSLEQYYEDLGRLAGKLYFKEVLVSRMNDILGQAVIRDIHFSSFFLK